jgi:hypothetical protein
MRAGDHLRREYGRFPRAHERGLDRLRACVRVCVQCSVTLHTKAGSLSLIASLLYNHRSGSSGITGPACADGSLAATADPHSRAAPRRLPWAVVSCAGDRRVEPGT